MKLVTVQSSSFLVLYANYEKRNKKYIDVTGCNLRDFLNGDYNVEGSQIRIGNNINVPVLQKKGTIVKIKGNDCWVQLANASMTVSFSLS